MIRRDINRLKDIVEREKENFPVLTAVAPLIFKTADQVNAAWQDFQAVSIQGDEERQERKDALTIIIKRIQEWEPAIMMHV
jgi:hypothetical protein